jgi:hypothetical protein
MVLNFAAFMVEKKRGSINHKKKDDYFPEALSFSFLFCQPPNEYLVQLNIWIGATLSALRTFAPLQWVACSNRCRMVYVCLCLQYI